jgi:hypothetical protein
MSFPSPSHLYDSIVASTDRMFFIRYLPAGTLRPAGILFLSTSIAVSPPRLQSTAVPAALFLVTYFAAIPMIAPPVMLVLVGGVNGIATPRIQPTVQFFSAI